MKTILITGSSTGIGRAAVEKFQAEGWNVAATMRTPEKETELQKLKNVEVMKLDVTDVKNFKTAVAQSIKKFGGIDVLLNNAGYGLAGPVEAVTPAQLERQYATNVFGPIYAMQACLPHFREKRSGVIINVTSIGGTLVLPFNSLYHGTKYALEGISESMALEVAPFGIKVKLVEPGGVKTDFASRSLDMTKKEGLTAYDSLMKNAMSVFMDPARAQDYSESPTIADVIFTAATDNSDKMRYLAGKDAKMMTAARKEKTDEEYQKWATQEFKLQC